MNYKTLRKGSRGEEVKLVQRALHLIDDGIFGNVTEEAVKTFQAERGLDSDGVVGPKTWAALAPTGVIYIKSKRKIKEIILHCTASVEGKPCTVEQIRQYHINGRGWSDIGYHYVIYADGSVHAGRDVNKVGTHCSGHNTYSIGVVYVGGLSKDGKTAKDTRTEAQKTALRNLVDDLCDLYGLTHKNVFGFGAKGLDILFDIITSDAYHSIAGCTQARLRVALIVGKILQTLRGDVIGFDNIVRLFGRLNRKCIFL